MFVVPDFPWLQQAVCLNEKWEANTFFPQNDHLTGPLDWTLPRSICNRCPVTHECLQWANDSDSRWGMYGGKTPDERRKQTNRDRRRKTA